MLIQDPIKAYQTVEQDLLVEGADPHSLVQILFTELLSNLDRAGESLEVKDYTAKSTHLSKSLTILHVLATSLDFERGGEVAQSLSAFYAWVRSQLLALTQDNSAERSRSSLTKVSVA